LLGKFLLKKLFLLLLLITHHSLLIAQDSCALRITLLTCAPGTDLYSTFGHTAVRVQNSSTGGDEVFNYGTFEFSPDFYLQFIRGKLLYALSVENFTDFSYAYQIESRSVVEQEILLNCSRKRQLYQALLTNAHESNRYYRYDFLLDNCTTRARDMIARHAGEPVEYKTIIPAQPPTFRNLLHVYLDKGGQQWSKLGIDLLLGSRIDRRITNEEAMFLPDNLMKAMDGSTAGGRPVVTSPQPVLSLPSPLNKNSWFSPLLLFSLLATFLALIGFSKQPWAQKFTAGSDFSLLLLSGLTGFLLLFMWWGTDHYWCGNNLNLLWALPTNAVAAFFLKRRPRWLRIYFIVITRWLVALLLTWFWLPQQLNPALLPLVGLLLLRIWALSKMST
jgi:hypothetical protein